VGIDLVGTANKRTAVGSVRRERATVQGAGIHEPRALVVQQ